ncbi:MAG: VOC family protein [Caulobacteraceae bacterium]
MKASNQKITTFFIFSGQAEEAMNFYTSIFDESEIRSIVRYGANEAGKEGTVLHATFSLKGQVFMCIDSSVEQQFTFNPAISLYVTCDNEDEINRYYDRLSQDGQVLMPLAAYPFSEKFAWVQDKYGVTWQLNYGGFMNSELK